MPWIGRYDGEKVTPEEVPDGAVVLCLVCEGRMVPRSKSSDGRARHFMHIDNLGGGDSGGGGDHDCTAVGESDVHKKWKSLATSRLSQIYPNEFIEEYGVEVRLGEDVPLPSGKDHRDADALLEFSSDQTPLGKGIIVEVQHRNTSKDIAAVEEDYLTLGYSVFWADKSHFASDRAHFSRPVLESESVSVWPNAMRYVDGTGPPTVDPAKTARAVGPTTKTRRVVDPTPHEPPELTENVPRGEATLRQARNNLKIPPNELSKPALRATLPAEWIDRRLYHLWGDTEFGDDLRPQRTEKHIEEVRSSVTKGTKPTGTIPIQEWEIAKAWEKTSIEDVLTPPARPTPFIREVRSAATHRDSPVVPATIHLQKWLVDGGHVLYNVIEPTEPPLSYRIEARKLSTDPPAKQFLIPDTLLSEVITSLKENPSAISDPTPPANPYNDVQCRFCGTYWHSSKEHLECSSCGEPVDWEWNVETGRISSDVIPTGEV